MRTLKKHLTLFCAVLGLVCHGTEDDETETVATNVALRVTDFSLSQTPLAFTFDVAWSDDSFSEMRG